MVRNSSRSGEIVLDAFLGSGSTLIACERLGRRCFGIELDPRYVDVAVKRWETFTGGKAERVATMRTETPPRGAR
jgi:DNA modification methylase